MPAQPLTFDGHTVGAPASNARAELFTPEGPGPFPAVAVLHGCDGVGPHYRIWARRLASSGYIALLVDSFRPRGEATVCNHGMTVPPQTRALDAFNAAADLRSRPNVVAARIGIIGFSHGGWAVLKAVPAATVDQATAAPFAAAVAFYPGCEPPGTPLQTDTLILIGEADDWTPVERCRRWVDQVQRNGHLARIKSYPGARHGFDAETKLHVYAGHYLGGNPQAAADAIAETRAFLAERLMPTP